ncbi:MAG TPA: T9SS type A sorting domain-containing protein, partial [Flavisolibacter sp.]|nr:T9SS type A sorting domain-containing protein [Flavisolibacter sp.]
GNITIRGISVNLINCTGYVSLKADVVSSQSPELTSVGCIAKGATFSPIDPVIGTASLGCGSVRKVQTTFFTTASRTIYFHMFKDVAPLGQITAADTAAANSVSNWYSLTTTAVGENNFSANGSFDYTVNNGEKFNVWVVAYAEGVPNVSASLASNSCAPLPVSFRSFTAQRNEKSVLVKWETVTEQQNRGFNIQRLVETGAWQNIGFVATQAANGNSSALLSYSFTDANPSSSVSQYRIQQIDIDGKTSYSEIRSVRGEEMSGNMVVYPNPSADGKITLSFDAVTAKDVTVSDMSGRVVKQFRNIRSNHLSIDNLTAGFYTVQVIDQSSAKTMVEKVVIKNH